MHIIIYVDDERCLTKSLLRSLKMGGHQVSLAHVGRIGLRVGRDAHADLIILDTGVPRMDILRAVRALLQGPIVVLSARGDDETVIAALQCGADDCVIAPFRPNVLLARFDAIYQRAARARRETAERRLDQSHPSDTVMCTTSLSQVEACIGLKLTPTESRILHVLLANEGHVLSAGRIMQYAAGHRFRSNIVVKTHILNLRHKLAMFPDTPVVIQTVRGIGYVAFRNSGVAKREDNFAG